MSAGSGRAGRRMLRFRDLGEDEPPDLACFSSVSENTRRFVERLDRAAVRVYYSAPHLGNENVEYFQDAHEICPEKILDTCAAATQHVDQGLSLTLFFEDTATTRDIDRAQIHAWRRGVKILYYLRLCQLALEGTGVEGCVSCAL